MNQHSQDRLDDASRPPSPSAQILPFERPQSDLQRAVQQRAQENINLDRERSRTRPAPVRWLVIAVIAAIPVTLLFGAIDRFLHVFYKMNDSYQSMPSTAEPPAPAPAPVQSEPGVVILQSIPTEQAEPAAQ